MTVFDEKHSFLDEEKTVFGEQKHFPDEGEHFPLQSKPVIAADDPVGPFRVENLHGF